MPSHVGLAGNEAADRLAREGAGRPVVDKHAPPMQMEDFEGLFHTHAIAEWQGEWNGSNTPYKAIQPLVNECPLRIYSPRPKDVVITRLILKRAKLNSYLFKIKAHPSGMCSSCDVLETEEHFVLNCSGPEAVVVRKYCTENNVPLDYNYLIYSKPISS